MCSLELLLATLSWWCSSLGIGGRSLLVYFFEDVLGAREPGGTAISIPRSIREEEEECGRSLMCGLCGRILEDIATTYVWKEDLFRNPYNRGGCNSFEQGRLFIDFIEQRIRAYGIFVLKGRL